MARPRKHDDDFDGVDAEEPDAEAAPAEAKVEAAKALVSALCAQVIAPEMLQYTAEGLRQQLLPRLEELEKVLSA